jgi:hypothetical protein
LVVLVAEPASVTGVPALVVAELGVSPAMIGPLKGEQHDDALHRQGGQAEWLGPVAGVAAVVPGQARGAADDVAEDRCRGDGARNKPRAQVVSSDHGLGEQQGRDDEPGEEHSDVRQFAELAGHIQQVDKDNADQADRSDAPPHYVPFDARC